MKISNFLIGIIVVGMFSTGFVIFYADIGTNYGKPFDNSTYAGYSQLGTINEDIAAINQSLTSIKQQSGITDLLGGFLASGYNILKITFHSFGAFYDMVETASGNVLVGSAVFIKSHLLAIGFIMFAFAIVSVLVNRDV